MFKLYGALRVADFGAIVLAAILAHTIYFSSTNPQLWQNNYLVAGFFGAVIGSVVFHLQGLYQYKVQAIPFGRLRIASLTVAWSMTILFLIVVAFSFRISDQFSRGWVVLWFSVALLAMTGARIGRWVIERAWLRSGKLARRIAVYGSGPNAATLIHRMKTSGDISFRIVGFFDSRTTRHDDGLAGETYLGTMADLINYGREDCIDQIIVALPWNAEERLLHICRKLSSLPVDIQLAPDFSGFHLLNSTFTYTGGVTLFNVFSKPLTDWHFVIKEVEDRALGIILITILAPLFGVIALAVRLTSPGPIFFRQKRYGFNNQLIEVYKFRTMYAHQTDANADKLATRDDPRVTKIGRFLRKTSFDELPQLLNVLKGEMSIVGPRPHATGAKAGSKLYEDVVDEYAARHRVKPGITGWAQVKGWRGETDTEEKITKRVEHDLYYIEHWSLALDIKILFLTVRAVLKPDNAY